MGKSIINKSNIITKMKKSGKMENCADILKVEGNFIDTYAININKRIETFCARITNFFNRKR